MISYSTRVLLPLLFVLFLISVTAQNSPTVITSFNFKTVNGIGSLPLAADGPWGLTAPEIVATMGINTASGFTKQSGTDTGPNAFAFEEGGNSTCIQNCDNNDAIRIDHNAAEGANYFQLNLSGTRLNEFSDYRFYCQVRRNTGSRQAYLQYSTNGTSYTTLAGSHINLPNESYIECLWDLTSITALNNVSQLYFRVQITGTNSNTRIDNVQVEAVNSVYDCSSGAFMTQYMVNGCSSGCEGADEYLLLYTGDNAYDLNNLTVAWPDDGYRVTRGYCHTACGAWDEESNNYFTQLSAARYNKYNTEASCGSLMIAPPSNGVVPPNSYVVVFAGCPEQTGCADYDFSAFCNGPIYGIAMGDLDCGDGRFNNSNQRSWEFSVDPICGIYKHTFQMGNPCGTYPCTVNGITYEDGETDLGQGIAVTSLTTGYKVSDVCLTPVPLPVELVDFQVTALGDVVQVNWVTASELNNDYFTVECSVDGVDWLEKGIVNGAGTTNAQQEYAFTDRRPFNGISYYRLKQTDYDGSIVHSELRSAFFAADGQVIQRVNLLGQEVNETYSGIVILILSNGERIKIFQ